MRGVFPFYKRDEREEAIHRLSRGEQASDFIKVTIHGSGVDGPSGTSERERARAHDETRCCCSAHTATTHSTNTPRPTD
jgi:hypothetical protein